MSRTYIRPLTVFGGLLQLKRKKRKGIGQSRPTEDGSGAKRAQRKRILSVTAA